MSLGNRDKALGAIAYGRIRGLTEIQVVHLLEQDNLLVPDGLRWEYAVEVRPDEDSEWQHTGPWWDTIEKARAWRGRAVIRIGQPYTHDRLVRRPVGPVEEVEEGLPPGVSR